MVVLLRHLAVVTYAVPAERLRPHLPAWAEPYGEPGTGFVSAVSFVWGGGPSEAVHTVSVQLNYRTYVAEGGEPIAWFLGGCVAHPALMVLHRLLGTPWRAGTLCLRVGGEGAAWRYQLTGTDDRGAVAIELAPDAGVASDLAVALMAVASGYLRTAAGLVKLPVHHPPLENRLCRVLRAAYPPLAGWGLVAPEAMGTPRWALYSREAPFGFGLPRLRTAR